MSPPTALVGLDPELTRDLADLATAAAETCGHVATEVGNVLEAAEIADNGAISLAQEIAQELNLLAKVLNARATQMELADVGIYFDFGEDAAHDALWASRQDGNGEGIDFDEERSHGEGGIPMSASVAAAQLAMYLGWLGDDEGIDAGVLYELLDNEACRPRSASRPSSSSTTTRPGSP